MYGRLFRAREEQFYDTTVVKRLDKIHVSTLDLRYWLMRSQRARHARTSLVSHPHTSRRRIIPIARGHKFQVAVKHRINVAGPSTRRMISGRESRDVSRALSAALLFLSRFRAGFADLDR